MISIVGGFSGCGLACCGLGGGIGSDMPKEVIAVLFMAMAIMVMVVGVMLEFMILEVMAEVVNGGGQSSGDPLFSPIFPP